MSGVRPAALCLDDVAGSDARALVIGLVNNMPDAALEATEQQFRDLLGAAGASRQGARPVTLRLFYLPQVPRGAAARARLDGHYETLARLREAPVDGLIVTGTEPRSARLQDEPYWDELAALVQWARQHTVSTVWSCLAAHAAVLQLDGIERRRFPEKLFGVFACPPLALHPLSSELGDLRRVPHSRFNDLPEERLAQAGYQVLARADGVGADLFVKECSSLFVFVQGHPEYDRRALAREYRRDVGRFLSAEREHYPPMPHGHFAEPAAQRFAAFRERALRERDLALLAQFPDPEQTGPLEAHWRPAAERLYANWLALLEQRAGAVSPIGAVPGARRAG